MIKRMVAFIKLKIEIARRKRVAKFMHNQALDSYFHYIKASGEDDD